MKIFIANGSALGSERLQMLLSDIPEIIISGYSDDAVEALELLRATKPDVLVIDIELRGGIALLKQIKKELPSLTTIVLSNAVDDQYRKKFREYGAGFFFDKSTEFKQVPEVIKGLVESSKREPSGEVSR